MPNEDEWLFSEQPIDDPYIDFDESDCDDWIFLDYKEEIPF